MSGGPGERFEVQMPAARMDRLREIIAQEDAAGREDETTAAIKELGYRLKYEADEWGESRDELPVIGFQLRFGVVGRIGVWYGVHPVRRIAFVKRFRLRGDPP